MARALPVHLIAMAVLIATTTYVVTTLGPALPTLARDTVIWLTGSYVVVWLALLGFGFAGRGDPEVVRRADRAIMWLGNAVSAISFWLQMPYADDALRLMVVIFLFGPVSVEVLGSIQRPPAKPGWVLTPLVLPLSTALYFAIHWGRYSAPVLLFSVAYLYVVMTLRRIVQRAVDRAYSARQAAEAAHEAKSRFLASASHDLGQPLQAGRLFFDQAMRGRTAAQRAGAARKVAWAFDTMEQLLRQMLDHLRLEAGAVVPVTDTVAVGPLIARLAELNEPAARLAGITILALPTRLLATADVSLAERALGNLVVNAIRHAKARRVLIGARRTLGKVRLWVIDDGVGVSDADAPRLFEDFVQGSNHGDEIRGGFGLGLASARRMAGLMGGEVGLERRWLAGSAFWLELPAAEAKAA